MKRILFLFFTLFLFASTTLLAQDRIYPRNSKKFIKAKISEVGLDEIKYKEFDNQDGPVFSIEKDEIEKIEYASGRIEKFEQSISAKVSIAEMHKNNLKIGFLSPIFCHLHISFEKGVKQGQSWEVHSTFIGVGQRPYPYTYYRPNTDFSEYYYKKQAGLMVGAGYKFSFTPDYIVRGSRSRHILQGSFFRPSAYLGGFKYNTYSINMSNNISTKKTTIFTGALIAELGKQWIMSNRASLEIYGGIGYGFDTRPIINRDFASVSDYTSFYYLYNRLSNNPSSNSFLVINGGIKLGYLFHTKKERENLKKK